MYDRGLGVKEDPKRACELYKLAADQGHHTAQYNVGYMYKIGRGVKSDELFLDLDHSYDQKDNAKV